LTTEVGVGMNDRKYNFIDLFAGAGGLSEGFISQGDFVPVAHVEMNKYASETLKTRACYYYLVENNLLNTYHSYLTGQINREQLYANVPDGLLDTIINQEISSDSVNRIFQIIDRIVNVHNLGEIDLIIGGPPCQAYSLMGRAVDAKNMQKDPRNYLYKQYIKFLTHYRPKAFVFENVPGIVTAGKGERFKRIIGAFRTAGYNVEYHILDAYDYGVLQQRMRMIIFGWRNDLQYHYPFPPVIHRKVTVNALLRDLSPLAPGEERNRYSPGRPSRYLKDTGIRKPGDVLTLHMCRIHNQNDLDIYRHIIEAWNNGHNRLKYYGLPEELRTRQNETSFVDRYKIVAGDMPYSHTMIAHIAKDGHYFIHPDINQCRSISVREAARIQSFPDDFYFEGPRSAKFTQIGNAVPPLMAQALAQEIAQMLAQEGDP
jgi:DNA (cytosine-5)-methyltransferase 1